MENFDTIFKILEIILAPIIVYLYKKIDTICKDIANLDKKITETNSSLRGEMLKDFATKQELSTSINALNITLQNLETKIDKLNDNFLELFKKGQ